MLGLALLFLLVALLAYYLGEGTVGAMSLTIAKVCLIIFVVLLILSFVFRGPVWGWPVPVGVW